jgi:hypothetical protein
MITKRQLGLIFISLGGVGLLGLLAIDWVRVGNYGGIGPMQRLGLLAAAAILLVGLSLLPFGHKPA